MTETAAVFLTGGSGDAIVSGLTTLYEVEKHFEIDYIHTNSGGSIAAALWRAGWSPQEVKRLFDNLGTKYLPKDDRWSKFRMAFKGAADSGKVYSKVLEGWVPEVVKTDVTHVVEALSLDSGQRQIEFGPHGHYDLGLYRKAVRASGNIPLMWDPVLMFQERHVDGFPNNFPVNSGLKEAKKRDHMIVSSPIRIADPWRPMSKINAITLVERIAKLYMDHASQLAAVPHLWPDESFFVYYREIETRLDTPTGWSLEFDKAQHVAQASMEWYVSRLNR